MKSLFQITALLSCLLASTITHGNEVEQFKAGVFSPARIAPDFVLKGSDGRDLKLTDYHGKVVVLGFGYSSCQAVCPVTLAVLSQAHRALGTLASQVQVIYVTVDPERDTPAKLKQFLTAFDPSFVGGSGTADQLAAVRKLYGVTAEKHGPSNDYVIAHSSSIYLIDRNGKLRALMPFGHTPEDYVHDLTALLKE